MNNSSLMRWRKCINEEGETVGYYAWDEKAGAYTFVPADQWRPPPLSEEGEETIPVTVQNYPEYWWLDPPDTDPPGTQKQNQSSSSPLQRKGAKAGRNSLAV